MSEHFLEGSSRQKEKKFHEVKIKEEGSRENEEKEKKEEEDSKENERKDLSTRITKHQNGATNQSRRKRKAEEI